MRNRISIFVALAGCFMTSCSTMPSSTHRIIPMADHTPSTNLEYGQNAIIHYALEDGTQRHKYCRIISADAHWLTVADKVEKNAESEKLSGWHSMIPIKNIIMIRVEIDSK